MTDPLHGDGPRLSEDGRFYWDGASWRPVPANPPAVPTSIVVKPARWRYVFWTLVILGPALLGFCGAWQQMSKAGQ